MIEKIFFIVIIPFRNEWKTMLYELRVKNFKSINNKIEIDFLSHQQKNDKYIPYQQVILFGANSSGKTNLLKSLLFIKDLVQGKKTLADYPNNKINPSNETEIGFTFEHKENKYQYTLSTHSGYITKEYLEVLSIKGVEQKDLYFKRDYNFNTLEDKCLANSILMKNKHLKMRFNKLFILEEENFKFEAIQHFNEYVQDKLVYINAADPFDIVKSKGFKYKKEHLQKFLDQFDLDIKIMKDDNNVSTIIAPITIVNNFKYINTDEKYKKIVRFLCNIYDALQNNKLIIVDNFGHGLHPLLSKHIVSLFKKNKKAQLFAASHSIELMDGLDKKQICLISKDRERNITDLYSLDDFEPSDEYGSNYLKGNYGAIPRVEVNKIDGNSAECVQDYMQGRFGGVPNIKR